MNTTKNSSSHHALVRTYASPRQFPADHRERFYPRLSTCLTLSVVFLLLGLNEIHAGTINGQERLNAIKQAKEAAKKKMDQTTAEFSAAESSLKNVEQDLKSLKDSIRNFENEEHRLKEEYYKISQNVIDSGGTGRGSAAFEEAQKWEREIVNTSKKLKESRAREPVLIKKISDAKQKYQVAQGNLYKAKKAYKRASRELAEEKSVPTTRQITKLPSSKTPSAIKVIQTEQMKKDWFDLLEHLEVTPSKSQVKKDTKAIISNQAKGSVLVENIRMQLVATLLDSIDFSKAEELDKKVIKLQSRPNHPGKNDSEFAKVTP